MGRAEVTRAEVKRVAEALRKHEARLDREFPHERGACCPMCVYGKPYVDLHWKIVRVEAWLQVLVKKVEAKERRWGA